MSVRTTIYLSEETRNRLNNFKEQHPELTLNISAVCEQAILKAIHRHEK